MKLTIKQKEALYRKRQIERLNFSELAAKLNCTRVQMVSAQMGNNLPYDVYEAVTNWIKEGKS
ncbi:hypothetical protein BSK66_31625 [Paenibacillus odorifer]|uniref:hypothetical protein n=1 Tax=Paenibacillus TaxID=44249 RepID=UPI0003E27217|nr:MULTISPECIES: hypothetical protein [Paenibacillus]ETT46221.1 hypothetical protein C171_28237 [Paenibacillus sp. FSL H8-237]OME46643.1 hypothetical protein BSK66_31625 [Paenibacillus odorifer]